MAQAPPELGALLASARASIEEWLEEGVTHYERGEAAVAAPARAAPATSGPGAEPGHHGRILGVLACPASLSSACKPFSQTVLFMGAEGLEPPTPAT